MPSFDIASKVDLQTLDNAINTVKKEISGRFDFRDSPVVVETSAVASNIDRNLFIQLVL